MQTSASVIGFNIDLPAAVRGRRDAVGSVPRMRTTDTPREHARPGAGSTATARPLAAR
jgi:hypothetical protein